MVNENAKMMPPGYAILQARSRHLPMLNAVELAAARIFPDKYLPEPILSDKLPMDVLLAAKEQGLLWVAVDAVGLPVGYILVQVVDGLALLAQVDVHPDHGSQGLGTALMRHAMGKIREKGFSECYLTTFSDIAWNAPFYAKLGFGIVGEAAMPKALAAILREEQERGLRNRVAMRLNR
ncbi:MAG: putative acetyltransferase [Solidesulfovibrio magneticus str. Maddingley MBC34]|uniref:Putative acetyltransferase n=1 Tax=Solidesulfovibrio magneticus str. Maddingley MBC34 TaxID=1206767 RepID=K6GN94_9BACT|nr:MAG: putative acetyltransferase [Solidesulfovibrio magneticus str. Maddingley MBC34]